MLLIQFSQTHSLSFFFFLFYFFFLFFGCHKCRFCSGCFFCEPSQPLSLTQFQQSIYVFIYFVLEKNAQCCWPEANSVVEHMYAECFLGFVEDCHIQSQIPDTVYSCIPGADNTETAMVAQMCGPSNMALSFQKGKAHMLTRKCL